MQGNQVVNPQGQGNDDVAALFGELDAFLPDLQDQSKDMDSMESIFSELDSAQPATNTPGRPPQVQHRHTLAATQMQTPDRNMLNTTPLATSSDPSRMALCVSPQNNNVHHHRVHQGNAQVVFRKMSKNEAEQKFQERHLHFCNVFRALDRQEAQSKQQKLAYQGAPIPRAGHAAATPRQTTPKRKASTQQSNNKKFQANEFTT
jgi:hypothetical protein